MAIRGADADLNGLVCGTTRSRRKPSELAERYDHYIGMVLAPKSRYPCAVFVESEPTSGGMALMTPNRKYVIGAGFFGSPSREDVEDCRRQHMLPGLCRAEDIKQGFGAALYIGGVMVMQAALDNQRGTFPSRFGDGAPCTYSYEGSREPPADAAWENLHTFKLARFSDEAVNVEDYDAEPQRFSFSMDANDFFDVYDLDRSIMDNEDNWESAKEDAARRLNVDEDDIFDVELSADVRGVDGEVRVSGYYRDPESGKEVFADILDFTTAVESGLILHLGPDFDSTDIIKTHLVPVPADVIGTIDWSQTPLRMIRDAILQQAEAEFRDSRSSYLAAALESLRRGGWSSVAEYLIGRGSFGDDDDGEEQQAFSFNPAPKSGKRHRELARDWEAVYGADTDWG